MADIAIFRINYKSDFILTLQSDAGWTTPFCVKFWTGAPSQAYYAYYDGMSYTHCAPVDGEPTKLLVQFDDHHLPIGDLKFQIGYHFTVSDFPTSIEDEVINQASVIIEVDDAPAQVMLDFNGETAPEIEFALPAYANEAQRIANEQARIAAEEQRIINEEARIAAEQERQQNEQQRINQEQQRISQEQQRVNAEAERVSDFASLKTESEAATAAANIAATLANEKAQLADDKAALAQAAATLANAKAQLAADKAALAQAAATLANEKAEYAQEQGDAAKTEAEAAHSLNEEVSHDEATRQQQETARQQAEAQRVIDFNAQMQQQQTAYTNAEAARDTAFDEAETERDAKVDAKVADITNLQAQIGYFVCDTAAATAAKTISATGYTLTTGGNIRIKMTNANTADSATLNINSTGAKALLYNGTQASSTNSWDAGEVLEVYYDGTNYQASNSQGGGGKAEKIKYDNSQSGLAADNVQEALDEIDNGLVEDEKVIAQALSSHKEKIDKVEADLTELRNNAITQDEMKVIAAALNELKDNEGSGESGDVPVHEGGVSGSVTVLNSDTISAFGSSFGTGACNIAGKNWIAKLSLFSDYRFENISFDGFNYYTLLRYTRIGTYVPTFHGKYALMACNENFGSSPIDIKIRALDNICTYFRVKGVIPIIASSYCYSQAESAALRNYADKHGYLFWDEAKYASLVKSGISKLGNGGNHLGTRDSTMVSDLYEKGMMLMEKPRQSIKIFRLREDVSYENKDAILFRNNEERASNFKELYIGIQCTNVPDGGGNLAGLTNEYTTLINGGNVVFTTPALISCILPVDANDLTSLALSIRSSVNIRVFTQNRMDGTYPTSQTYTRFSVNGLSMLPAAGTVYSNENTTYTVISITSGLATGYDYYVYCSPTTSDTIGSGILTKVSGEGPSSISFDIGEASTLSVDNVVLTDTVGHWVEIPQISGKYRIATSDIVKCVDKDRIDFLIIFDDASCQLSQISVDYTGVAIKQSTTRRYLDFNSNYWCSADEIIPETTFGTVGSTSAIWKDDNNNFVSSVAAGVAAYPLGCSSCVKVNRDNAINYTIPRESLSIGGEGVLELWCRFFPDVYTDGSGNQITTESYDYRNICVQMNTAILSEKVGLMWKVVQFPISLFVNEELPLRIYSDSADGLEICKVSFKFKNN